MKITFPHMGNAYVAIRVFLDTLGLPYYLPSVGSRASMERGAALSPEFMCLPFKTILGDLIDGLEHGADTILFGGGCGQCRLSYYGDLLQEILREQGYAFRYYALDLNHITYAEAMRFAGPLIGDTSRARVAAALTRGVRTVFATDKLYETAREKRCIERQPGDCDRILRAFEAQAQAGPGGAALRRALEEAAEQLRRVPVDLRRRPVEVALVGEIFLSSDAFTNLDIERRLGRLGAHVRNTMSVGEWIGKHCVRCMLPSVRPDPAIRAAQPYLRTDDVGGHGIYTVGNAARLVRGGCDGIIQIYPFTCMPEIIAQTALAEIRETSGVPIMTLILDEMTGEVGYETRLEAFVDMLRMRRDERARSG